MFVTSYFGSSGSNQRDVNMDSLQRLCDCEQILCMGNKTKKPIIDAIIDWKINPPKELPKMRKMLRIEKDFVMSYSMILIVPN